MIMGSKIHAILAGRINVAFDDVRRVALPALRHRLILNYEAEAKGVTADRVGLTPGEPLPALHGAA